MPQPERRIVDKPIPGPSPTLMERLRRKRMSDIPLPNDTGKVDERIKKKANFWDKFKAIAAEKK